MTNPESRCECSHCGKVFYREKNRQRVRRNFCTPDCSKQYAKALYSSGVVEVFFDGRMVNEYKFTARHVLRNIFDVCCDLYAGGELVIRLNYKEEHDRVWPEQDEKFKNEINNI